MSTAPWIFTPFPPLPSPLLPNIAFYNATSPALNKSYQLSVSYPFEWGPGPSSLVTNKSAHAMYVLDGNALGLTAHEAFFRRKAVDATQPDSVVITVGYHLTDSVYGLTQRGTDFRPPIPGVEQTRPAGADAFLEFLGGELKEWVKSEMFPGVRVKREALYGHSFGGLFVVYALLNEPGWWDTYLAASPALNWAGGRMLGEVSRRFGNGVDVKGEVVFTANVSRPAVFIGYEGLGQFPVRRRTETEAEFQIRKNGTQLNMTVYSHELFDRLKGSGVLRDVTLKEYAGQDHAGVGASALTDGIDYFLDW